MPRKNGEMTKAEHRKFKADWAQSVIDGRVLDLGDYKKSYPTHAMMQHDINVMTEAGLPFKIVKVP